MIVPDYFGFGRSDKPLRIEDYTYDFHFRSIERLVNELALTRLTVVVQDWGGPIGLRLAVERPELVDRIVLLNTGIGAGRAPSPEWLRFRDFVRRVGDELVASRLIALSLVSPPGETVLAAYDAPFPARGEGRDAGVPRARSHRARPPVGGRDAAGPRRARPAGGSRPSCSSPTRTRSSRRRSRATGGADPRSRPAEIVAGAGHFLQEDKGEEIAERIVRFLHET